MIRKNYELYGHPDGKRDTSMGIALPKWIIESKNNGWVIGVYGLAFGLLLPYFVVRRRALAQQIPRRRLLMSGRLAHSHDGGPAAASTPKTRS